MKASRLVFQGDIMSTRIENAQQQDPPLIVTEAQLPYSRSRWVNILHDINYNAYYLQLISDLIPAVS